jgi:hypothetical protein
MKSRTRFHNALAAGSTRSEAARKAHIRSNTTAQRWHQDWLAARARVAAEAGEAEKQRQAATRAAEAERKAQEDRRLAREEHLRLNPPPPPPPPAPRCSLCGFSDCIHLRPADPDPIAAAYRTPDLPPGNSNPRNLVQDPHNRQYVPANPEAHWAAYWQNLADERASQLEADFNTEAQAEWEALNR